MYVNRAKKMKNKSIVMGVFKSALVLNGAWRGLDSVFISNYHWCIRLTVQRVGGAFQRRGVCVCGINVITASNIQFNLFAARYLKTCLVEVGRIKSKG